MAEEVEDWGTNNQVRKSGNSLFTPPQVLRKLQNCPIFQMPQSCGEHYGDVRYMNFIHVNKHKLWMLLNIPCYLIFLSSSLFNTPRYPSLLNSLHSFDALSACDDFKALLLHSM